MLHPKKRWVYPEVRADFAQTIQETYGVSSLVSQVLANRVERVEECEQWIHEPAQAFHDPFSFYDMDKAVNRIRTAVDQEERILVYGDYDADGVTSTSLLVSVLQDLGAIVSYYIPNRFTEGYGPNAAAFRHAFEEGVTLLITVDNGISGIEPVAKAQSWGMDVIVTDHHEMGPELPEAFATIHPRHPSGAYPFGELAGVGVTWKLAHALLGDVPEHYLDLVAIGTVCDLVPLVGENRFIVQRGLRRLQQTNRIGLRALCQKAGTDMAGITEEGIGFTIGPRLNAPGRLGDADVAVELLREEDPEQALLYTDEIDAINKERQKLVSQTTKEAEELVKENDDKVLVIAQEGWNPGILGIVASKIVREYEKPTFVLAIDKDKGTAKGSARGIQSWDLYRALSTCRDILPHFGGHARAAGLTIKLENLDLLRERLNQLAEEELTEDDFVPIQQIDAILSLEDVTLDAIEELEKLAPFGMNHPKPYVLLENVPKTTVRKIGSQQNHAKLTFIDGEAKVDGVAFGNGALADLLSKGARCSVVGQLQMNEWNGRRSPQMIVEDVAVAHCQVFDWREQVKKLQQLRHLRREDVRFVSFGEGALDALGLKQEPFPSEHHYSESNERHVVLVDLPPSVEALHDEIKAHDPTHIYALFHEASSAYFEHLPKREQFKWWYAMIGQKGPFHMERDLPRIAKSKKWSVASIRFMSQVFFELEFATIEDGLIRASTSPMKRSLKESATYRRFQAQAEIEQRLLYCSYEELQEQLLPCQKEKQQVLV